MGTTSTTAERVIIVRIPRSEGELEAAIESGRLIRVTAPPSFRMVMLHLESKDGIDRFATQISGEKLPRTYTERRRACSYNEQDGVKLSYEYKWETLSEDNPEYENVKRRLEEAGGFN